MNLAEIAKETLGTMVNDRPFPLVAILVILALPIGCGPTLQERMTEVQEQSLRLAKKDAESAARIEQQFLECMNGYAQTNAQSSSTASEIAEAAVSHCEPDLSLYRLRRSSYHYESVKARGDFRSLSDLDRAREKGKEKGRVDALDLLEQGKRLVIKTVIQSRR